MTPWHLVAVLGELFVVDSAEDASETLEWVHRILREERGIVIVSRPLQVSVAALIQYGASPL